MPRSIEEEWGTGGLHRVGKYELKYEHRGSWKAERYEAGHLVDTIPVTWSSGWRKGGSRQFLLVWFQSRTERDRYLDLAEPFPVALALERDPDVRPPEFVSFQGVFLVKSTGRSDGDFGVECDIIERLDSGTPSKGQKPSRR